MLNVNQEMQQGRCRILRQLDQEQTVLLFEAFDKVLAKNVLLKEISVKADNTADLSNGARQNDAFAEEAKFLSEIKHDGFLQILGHFSEGGARYLVMESVDGKNLGELIKNNGKLVSPANVLDCGKQILDALDYLHKKNLAVLYFDLKPTNIYLNSDGKIKLLTTGISGRSGSDGKIKKRAFDKANLNYSPLEVIWEKLDPASQRVILNGFDEESEQSLTKQPDVRCDIYSLGATLYHLLTGKLPVNALERSIELLEENPDPLSAPHKINPNITVELSDVLMKSLKIRREDRFHSALEMHEELENVFILLRERKIRELQVKNPATPAILSVKPKTDAPKNQNSYEKPRINSEENKQLEIIKRKLREAEAQRLSAEKRAAEAERRLIEMEKHKSNDYDILELTELAEVTVELPKISQPVEQEKIVEILDAEIIEDSAVEEVLFEQAEIIEGEIAENDSSEKEFPAKLQEDSFEDFENMFAAPQKNNKFFKRIAATVIGLLIIGGGIWAVFNFLPTASPNLEVLNQTVSAVEPPPAAEPPPLFEATPEMETETAPELSGEAEITEESPKTQENFTETRQKPVAVKQKTPAPQIATVKQPERKPVVAVEKKKKVSVDELIKDKPTKKKKVTIDDLINDN